MKARVSLVIACMAVSGCMSESKRLSQLLSSDSGMSCDDRKSELESMWNESLGPTVRAALTKSATWSGASNSEQNGIAAAGTRFEFVMRDFELRPSMLLGNQSVSMGHDCESPKAHFSLMGLEAESTTLMSACIDIPILGSTCEKSDARLLATARNVMISVDLLQDQHVLSFSQPRLTFNLSELRLADPLADFLDGRASLVFSRFQPSWEDAIVERFEQSIRAGLSSVFERLKCDLEQMNCALK